MHSTFSLTSFIGTSLLFISGNKVNFNFDFASLCNGLRTHLHEISQGDLHHRTYKRIVRYANCRAIYPPGISLPISRQAFSFLVLGNMLKDEPLSDFLRFVAGGNLITLLRSFQPQKRQSLCRGFNSLEPRNWNKVVYTRSLGKLITKTKGSSAVERELQVDI